MCTICPTVTPASKDDYSQALARVEDLSPRLHLDFMDEDFTGVSSPNLVEISIPKNKQIDLHVMYKRPAEHTETFIALAPSLVIVHAEAECDFVSFTEELHSFGIKVGLALLQDTSVESVKDILPMFDHVLVFSGHLGHHGGSADLSLLTKVKELHELHAELEVSWDGGINKQNASELCRGGVDVLNVGGAIQHAHDPQKSYKELMSAIDKK